VGAGAQPWRASSIQKKNGKNKIFKKKLHINKQTLTAFLIAYFQKK
jgi:hypothetical protein